MELNECCNLIRKYEIKKKKKSKWTPLNTIAKYFFHIKEKRNKKAKYLIRRKSVKQNTEKPQIFSKKVSVGTKDNTDVAHFIPKK